MLAGGCHCGAIRVDFTPGVPIEALEVRACQCSFCRRHAQQSVTDPAGSLRIVADPAHLSRYQFGLRTCEMLVCARCGVYVGAYLADPPRATVNINVFDARDRFAPAVAVDYSAEDATSRLGRRAERWTPAELVLRG